QGEIFGLIGPDGAGKTTTLRMLAAVLKPSGGHAAIMGYDIQRHAEHLRHFTGYMPQRFSLYGDLSVIENLEFFADIFGVRGAVRQQRIERLLHFARLEQFKARAADHLSGGMKKKLALACALIHQPQVLLLDEPTNGVDPVSRREFWDILADLHLENVTILIATPYMDEAERCNRVGLMYNGQLIQQGSPAELRQFVPGEMLAVYTSDLLGAETVISTYPQHLGHQVYGDRIHVFVPDAAANVQPLQAFLQDHDVPVQRIRPDAPRLEEAFIYLITQQQAT
ncbi:MAG: ABC transporter ATP-binding protein, partial [Chloroflexi bacterium]|nr:ABC transporter ATP-binding protein [Chloroflexota bacterium]